MIRLLSKKQIYMEGGYMLDSSNMLLQVIIGIGSLFGMMMSFYLALCFIQWISDVIDEKRWMIWKEWFQW